METANVTYQDAAGNIKVKVDNAKCIACGHCVFACKHDARYFEDDTELFFADLTKGTPISLVAAPAVRTNIPEYKRLFAYLKALGVRKIYDVSFGADISIWAHIRYMEKYHPEPMITSPCPSIVSYCKIYRQDLLAKLFPVHGPMACTAVFMKEYEGVQDELAALSPCVAKANEFEDTGLIRYNVTIAKLYEHLKRNNICLPSEETEFDRYESGLGALFPMPGGLKENIDFFTGRRFRISHAEGSGIYSKLNTFAKTPTELLPDVYDVLNCTEGCNEGSGCLHGMSVFEIGAGMDKSRKAATESHSMEHFESLYKELDGKLKLAHFLREYAPADAAFPEISENDIEEAFALLEKSDDAMRNVDCGACGSETCHEMARKIALRVNIPENCIVKSRNDARDMLERFETVWNKVESGIAIIDANTRVTLDVNPVAVRMFGDSKESIVGKRCNQTFCLDERCPVTEKSLVIDHSEREFVNSAGKRIPIVKSVSMIHYDGRPALLESFTDISSLKEAEEKINKMRLAEQASHAKSNFLSNMSHEMRTPMNAIIGMTQIAAKSGDVEKLQYCLSMIENSSTHLLGLINDILDMSKIEAGKFDLERVPIDIEKMLTKVSNLFIEKIEMKCIHFNIIIAPDMRMNFIGDELRLTQVVTNLTSNALKFTPEGGEIEIEAQEVEREDGYGVLRFTVKDTGIGMTEEQKARLFNVFEQADSSTSRKFGGTGLGLAISKSIVEKMGGRIWVETEAGKGSNFIFEVRLDRPKYQNRAVFFRNVHPDEVKLLVVDGDSESRGYFKAVADSFGVNADEADSSEMALSLLKLAVEAQKPYDIVFADHSPPSMDGLELASGMGGEIGKGTSLVIMTSFLKWNRIEKDAQHLGVSRFISKPLFPSAILNAINETIGANTQIPDKKPAITAGSSRPDFSGVMLLFAEDVEINREIFISLLDDTGVDIDIAENGKVAVDKFKANPGRYDMIIMDVQMPVMDGLDATRAIRSLDAERAKSIPIVAMTANVFKEDVDKCIESGMNDHLAKPIDIEAVCKKIALYRRK